ncbi:carbohydrate ABC transporter permease [Paenibacillus sp. HB172176]|uniref:carbohydrate ABC transporter permease n=1 Tax=Paenibacillus sp. HB172176 TaxID=2493690 RepID=UPI00143A550F|nr:carbohydrate ABC transporter permease [Paenibacillus sp. HB172176]
MRISRGERLFVGFNYAALTLLGLLCIAPFINIFAQSLSGHYAIVSGQVGMLPVDPTLQAYDKVFQDKTFLMSMGISIMRTGVGVALSVLLTVLMAYPLSKPYIKGRSVIMFLLVFSMLFGSGMIPNYLLNKSLGLLDTFWVMVIPTLIAGFHVIIVRSFFQNVPGELEESARIDGCGNLGILFRIVFPLSMPVIATIALFKAVVHWNAFFDAVLYINNQDLMPLQVYLRNLIMMNASMINTGDIRMDEELIANESLKAAALFTSMIPILIVYPFLQKYFVKGMLIGSVKG